MSRGSETLNKAVTVKLTRPLAIVPITLGLSLIMAKKSAKEDVKTAKFSLKRAFPMFILYFVIAAIVTTLCIHMGVSAEMFDVTEHTLRFYTDKGRLPCQRDGVKLLTPLNTFDIIYQ